MICRNCDTDNQQHHLPSNTFTLAKRKPHLTPNTCASARQQPHLAEIRRWRRQSVQMGRKICVCLSSSPTWQQWGWARSTLLRRVRFVAGRGAVVELLVRAASGSCWPGRRSGATGTGSQRKQLAGAPREGWSEAEVCAEKLAARRATMRRHRGRACRWAGDYAAASWKSLPLGERRRCGKGKVQSSLGMVQSIIGKRLNGSNQHFTPFLFQCHRPHIAIPIITKYNSAA